MRSILRLITRRFNNIGNDHRRVARGLYLVTFFILIGKVAAAAKEVAIAYKFGVGELVDLYLLAFTFAIWVPSLCGTIIHTIYVPLIHKLGEHEKRRFKAQFMGATLVLSGLLTLALLWGFPLLLEQLSNNWSAENRDSIRKLSIGFAPLAGLGLLAATFSSMLLAEERHANTLLELIPSLTLALFVIFWPFNPTIDPLAWGTLLGFILQTFGLFLLLKSARLSVTPQLSFSSTGWIQFRQDIGIVFLSQFVMSFVEPISSIIATTLGTGSVSGLGYSTRILALFLTLGATAISRALLPVLSNNTRQNSEIKKMAIQWSALLFIGGTITAIITWFFVPFIVKTLLERGAFTTDDTAAVASAVRYGVAQFPFYFSGVVLAQYFISMRRYKLMLASSCIALTTKIFFSITLSPLLSYAGIILASVPMYLATNLFFVLHLIREKNTSRA